MSRREPIRVGIVGGGISGLACAFFLRQEGLQRGRELDVTLIESSNRLGGVIASEHRDGFLLEYGPDSFMARGGALLDLVQQLQLQDQLVGSQDQRRKTFVVQEGRLRPLPDGMAFLAPVRLVPFFKTAPLSWRGKLRVLLEPIQGKSTGDPSVRQFFEHRLGREFTEGIVEPLVSAIYGGDIGALSAASNLSQLYQAEQRHGSLWRGLRRAALSSKEDGATFLTFRSGMTTLVERLHQQLEDIRLQTSTPVRELDRVGESFRLRGPGFEATFDALVLAVPAPAGASLLEKLEPDIARELGQIPYRSSRLVHLAYKRSEFSHPLEGFGFVVPRKEATVLDACTWVSSKFPGRSPEDAVLLRCALHERRGRKSLKGDDDGIVEQVHEELQRILGIRCSPLLRQIRHVGQAVPQMVVGHQQRLAALQSRLGSLPGLFFASSFWGGVSVPDCVQTARNTARSVLDFAETET